MRRNIGKFTKSLIYRNDVITELFGLLNILRKDNMHNLDHLSWLGGRVVNHKAYYYEDILVRARQDVKNIVLGRPTKYYW